MTHTSSRPRRPCWPLASLLLLCHAHADTGDTHTGYEQQSGREIHYRALPDGSAVAFGDILIGDHERILREGIAPIGIAPDSTSRRKKRTVWSGATPWPNNTIHYEFDASADPKTRSAILGAMRQFEQRTTLRFVEDAAQPYRVRIGTKPHAKGMCGIANIGRLPKEMQPQSLRLFCPDVGTALHELMHTAGFFHESLRKPDAPGVQPADPDSIMGKGHHALSPGDIAGIRSLYPPVPVPDKPDTSTPRTPIFPIEDSAKPADRQKARLLRSAHGTDACLAALDDRDSWFWRNKERTVGTRKCDGKDPAQRWTLQADGRLTNDAYPSRCLGKASWNTVLARHESGHAALMSCARGPEQRWHFAGSQLQNRGAPTLRLIVDQGAVLVDAPPADALDRAVWSWAWPDRTAPEPRYRQLQADDGLCLAALDKRSSWYWRHGERTVVPQPCDSKNNAQRWALLGDGRLKNAAWPALCLGKASWERQLADNETGYAALQACGDAPSLRWRFAGTRLKNLGAPGLVLANRNGAALVEAESTALATTGKAGWHWR
ncbi:M12 family metallopeptidase [Paludibacterium paludis]|uniref:Peptidase M12A domain-containing protein n=1 Tax=Paludibacterium paludis TaxID=1225769 RepID=A0A918P042_9NEIS|nr:M12 family metallopeptidase [Paludibacterium paludis]GGY08050.1 hypothetical protein GCM10011289_08320 [Paludibacterium paludis]